MRALALGLMIMATPALAAEQQFDLVCRGTVKYSTMGKEKPTEVRYRVDLASNSYCWWKCENVAQIARVEPGQIVFQEILPKFPSRKTELLTVDRISGAWVDQRDDGKTLGGDYVRYEGTCSKEPFSGFPATKF